MVKPVYCAQPDQYNITVDSWIRIYCFNNRLTVQVYFKATENWLSHVEMLYLVLAHRQYPLWGLKTAVRIDIVTQKYRIPMSCCVVLSEAVDGCICFTRKIQHGGDWERSRPQGSRNVQNFLMTVRPLSWAFGIETEMLLILKKPIFDLITPQYFLIWQSKEMSHEFVRGQSVAETCFSHLV